MTSASVRVSENAAKSMQAAAEKAAVKASRGGAPEGNFNAMRSGLKASKLPKKCKGEEREIYSLRQEILDELVAEHGSAESIPLLPLALLQSCVRHETRARLAARWLRLEGDGMALERRLALLDTISKATDARDRCIEKMGLTMLTLDGSRHGTASKSHAADDPLMSGPAPEDYLLPIPPREPQPNAAARPPDSPAAPAADQPAHAAPAVQPVDGHSGPPA